MNDRNENNKREPGLIKKVVLVLLLAIGAVAGFAQEPNSPYCLKVKVKPTIDSKPVKGVTVKLFKSDHEVTRIESTEASSVMLSLEKNAYYTIEIEEEGRLPRRVSFTTDLPDDVPLWPMFRYEMSVELPPMMNPGVDDFYLDFPIALVSYNEDRDAFEHSKEYTAHIKQQMQKMQVESIIVNK